MSAVTVRPLSDHERRDWLKALREDVGPSVSLSDVPKFQAERGAAVGFGFTEDQARRDLHARRTGADFGACAQADLVDLLGGLEEAIRG